ncbi:hypothetical protein FP026_25605 [Rhizobium tropici]|uniref:Uncharacterized protein n=2 Tax=Rhizobium tropici TaxID=398 RepID=A0A5B0VRI2_RHITR|nr:hypothetical protein FP026_25605 [Rhizobium tropici]
MAKQTKPFIFEIKNSRRKKTGSVEQPKSIWGAFASDLKHGLVPENEERVRSAAPAPGPVPSELKPAVLADGDDAATLPPRSRFIEKWAARKAEKPKAGPGDAVATFLARIERQKALLAEFRAHPSGFKKWRSAWFREVTGGFGVSISYDAVDAGGGLRYLVVETAQDVAEFLDDLAQHAQTDVNFQRVLKETRLQRAARRVGG